MDIKKILALTIVLLALFICLSAASAGLSGSSSEKNQTYTFDGFTLDIPESASVTYKNDSANVTINTGNSTEEKYIEKNIYTIKLEDGDNITVFTTLGSPVSTIEKYIDHMVNAGAINEGTYGNWTILNLNNHTFTIENSTNITTGYILVKFIDGKCIGLYDTDLNNLKKLADTYKDI